MTKSGKKRIKRCCRGGREVKPYRSGAVNKNQQPICFIPTHANQEIQKLLAMGSLNILIVGSGGREHALAWRLSQSHLVSRIFVAPGNGGTAIGSKCSNVAISASDFPKLVDFAVSHDINLVVPGPEQPLVDGIEAYFRKGSSKTFSLLPPDNL